MRNLHGRPTSASSYEFVDAPLYCVLTRIQLRHLWALPSMIHLYRQVRCDARKIRSLKRCALLVENVRTFFILSIWEGEDGFLEFGTHVMPHLTAARRGLAKADAAERGSRRPAIWSTEWRVRAVSHNLNWGDPQDWEGLLMRDPCAVGDLSMYSER